jgi:protein-S-isoprenylcysteine O-methyltransferase Ste14
LTIWRQIRAIGLLPGVTAFVVPALIVATTEEAGFTWPGAVVGIPLLAAGLSLMWKTITLFSRAGEGTLAPWDPPRKFVVLGPYRHVRNPMITGVVLVQFGEAALLGSIGILVWAAVFAVANALWMPLIEEPALERRFGEDYAAFKRNVPRWVPRRTPWTP